MYNYDEWFDGQRWALTKGEDFTCKTSSMLSGIKNQLESRGLVATVGSLGDEVFVQVTGEMTDEQKEVVREKREAEAAKRELKKLEAAKEAEAPAKKTAPKKTTARK